MARRLLIILTILFVYLPCKCRELVLSVSDQTGFDTLSSRLDQALRGTDDVTVIFSPGVYFYKESHLAISNVQRPNLTLSFRCDGAMFIPAEGIDKKWDDVFVDLDSQEGVERFTPLKQVLRRPEILDRKKGLCRVRTKEKGVSSKKVDDMYLVLTQWYTSQVYEVERIDRGYIYFRSDKAITSDGSPWSDPDSDYHYGRVLPRYVLLKPSMALSGLHRGTASRFMTVSGSHLRTLSITGAHFIGNGGKDCLIQFYRVKADSIAVIRCQFEYLHGNAVQVQYSGRFYFLENRLSRLWRNGVIVDYYSPGAVISDNRFEDTGLLMMQDFCIIVRGSDFQINDNMFCNFTYGAIGIGTHYRESIPASSSGVVERNELYCTDGFSRYLMDSGAIYTWTVNKDVTIRQNFIHDIGGYKDNRGILCDDGTINVKILNNKVLRIQNSYCIDLRHVPSVEREIKSNVKRVNVGNRMEGNIVDGKVRFENRD